MHIVLMSLFYGLLSFWITRFIVIFRKQLTSMIGMMAAMALGMTIGLAMGGLVAVWLPDQFFHSTMIGMLIGGAVGVMAGIPISLMAVIDGLLSGIMGGMMGTMLMVMMSADYVAITIKLMSVICSGIVFLVFVMLLGAVSPDYLKEKSFVMSKPIAMFFVIVFAIIII